MAAKAHIVSLVLKTQKQLFLEMALAQAATAVTVTTAWLAANPNQSGGIYGKLCMWIGLASLR